MKKIPLFLFILILATEAASQNLSISRQVDSFIVKKMKQYQIPGIAMAVIKNNVVIKKSFYGFSNLDNNVPVTNKTIFPIASMDKQITATSIMMLYEQGKLKLTDSISHFLDSVPDTWNKILIKHLLSHTSGIPDEVAENYKGRSMIYYTNEEILDHIKKQVLQFAPGNGFLYSDAGFVILQRIVQKISGMDYEKFLNQNILGPLGMTNTQILDPTQIVKHRATSYYRDWDKKIFVNTYRQINYGPFFNDIGTNIDDFIKYDIAINSHTLLKKQTYDMMWSPYILNNGRSISNFFDEQKLFYANASYGFAWAIEKFKQHRIVYHGGFTGTSITKLPDDNLTIILFANLTDRAGFNPEVMGRNIASFYTSSSSSFLMKPKLDPDPKVTVFIKETLVKLENGIIDSVIVARDYFKPLSDALPGFRQRLGNYGQLQSLQFQAKENSLEKSIIYYKAIYPNGILFYSIVLTRDNKIDFISAERE